MRRCIWIGLMAAGCAWVSDDEVAALTASGDGGPALDTAADGTDGTTDGTDGTTDGTDGTDCETTWYADADGDGFGDAEASQEACEQPDDHVADATDCDDARAGVYPGALEVCDDGVDQDCDGADTEVCRPEGTLALDDGGAARIFEGGSADRLGQTLFTADVTGDGLVDVVAGSRSGVFVFAGPVSAAGAVSDIEVADLHLQEAESPAGTASFLGDAAQPFAVLPDGDGDGVAELLMLSGGHARSGATDVGLIYRRSGPLGAREVILDGDQALFEGHDTEGAALHVQGSLTAAVIEGVPWLLVGSGAWNDSVGQVLLIEDPMAQWSGPRLSTDPAQDFIRAPTIDTGSTDRAFKLTGSVSTACDLNGTGVPRFVVGAPGTSGGTGAVGGVVYVLPQDPSRVDDLGDGLLVREGAGDTEIRFGSSLACGDLDGDGTDDLVVGAVGSSGSGGHVFVFASTVSDFASGPPLATDTDPWLRIDGQAADAALGAQVAVAPALDGDDAAELLAGAPRHADLQGAVYGWYDLSGGTLEVPTSSSADLTLTVVEAHARLGHALSARHDLDGDRFTDVLVGARDGGPDDGSDVGDGRLFLLLGAPAP